MTLHSGFIYCEMSYLRQKQEYINTLKTRNPLVRPIRPAITWNDVILILITKDSGPACV